MLLYHQSHPTMGAWIEITYVISDLVMCERRTPRWVRGLKFFRKSSPTAHAWSHPTMGAWIEMALNMNLSDCLYVAPHDGCVD